jgi:hypothetical protein
MRAGSKNLELPDEQIPMGENDNCVYNIQLARIGLVRSVEWEHGAGMDHIESARTTYPVTQVGYDTMLVMYTENQHC